MALAGLIATTAQADNWTTRFGHTIHPVGVLPEGHTVCPTIEQLRWEDHYQHKDTESCRKPPAKIAVRVELVAIIQNYRERLWIVRVKPIRFSLPAMFAVWHREALGL